MYCGGGKVVGAVAVSVWVQQVSGTLFRTGTADWSHGSSIVAEMYHTAHCMLRTVFATRVPDLERLLLPHHRSHRPLRGSGDFSGSFAYSWPSPEIQRSCSRCPWRVTSCHGPHLLQRLCRSLSLLEHRLRGRYRPTITEACVVYYLWQRPAGRGMGSSKLEMVKSEVKDKEEVELASVRLCCAATMDRDFPTR